VAPQSIDQLVAEVRSEFDRVYLGGIPGLLTDDGAFLSFVATTTGTEALAGFFAPQLGNDSTKRGTVTVAGKPSIDIPPGTLNSALKQAGLKKPE
jgi:hypothetical protein